MIKLIRIFIALIVAMKLEPASSQNVCVDKLTNCREQLNIKNYCIDTDLEIRQFFITQCQRSCGVCGTGTGTGPTPNKCKTIAGPSFNRDCILPFVFNGTRYNRCAFDSDGFWCSTLVDSRGTHIPGNWGICGSNCPKVPTCSDGIQNQFETGIDCGGPCKACKNDPCNPNPCKNNGTCAKKTSPKTTRITYTCKCTKGFTGQNCTKKICEDKAKNCEKRKKFCGKKPKVDRSCQKTCKNCKRPSLPDDFATLCKQDYANCQLKKHNELRKKHGSSNMTLDTKLNKGAKQWAKMLADKEKLDHKKGEAENLWYGCGNNDPAVATQEWYDEIKKYNFKNPGFSKETGHFTQVVWNASVRLGIGKAESKNGCVYVVARYSPAGNMEGEFRLNVVKPTN